MIHMLSCFDLKPGVELAEYQEALDAFVAHMQGLDLVESNSPVGRRQRDTILDTDSERDHEFFMTTHFRDWAQANAAIDYIKAHAEPGHSIHLNVHTKAQNQIFVCWEDT